MNDLVTWLGEQLDEDARIAKVAAGDSAGHWSAPAWGDADLEDDHGDVVMYQDSRSDTQEPHIARWDPARVLVEVEAKRAILDLHHEYRGVCGYCVNAHGPHQRESWPCPTVRALALPYRDRPGYRPVHKGEK